MRSSLAAFIVALAVVILGAPLLAPPAVSQTTPDPNISRPPDVIDPLEVRSADVDGDGDDDPVVFSQTGTVWFENRLDETETSFVKTVVSNQVTGYDGVLADFDGDGAVDVFGSDVFRSPRIALNDGSGTFSQLLYLRTTVSGGNVSNPHAADVDQDGDLDVVAYHMLDGQVVWFENTLADTGTFDFEAEAALTAVSEGQGAFNVAYLRVADLSGDAYPDLVYTTGRKVVWHENLRPTQDTYSDPRVLFESSTYNAGALRTGDLNGDGQLDLIVNANGDLLAFRNQSADETTPEFGDAIQISITESNYILVTNTTGSDLPDILLSTRDGIQQIENTTTSSGISFGALQPLSEDFRIRGFAAADLDGDSRQDVLTLDQATFAVKHFRGTPSGLSAPTVVSRPPEMVFPRAVAAADLDGDQDPDVVAADVSLEKVVWYENRVQATETDHGPENVLLSDRAVFDLALTDVDGDGKTDVVLAARGLFWLKNTSSGGEVSFAPLATISPQSAGAVHAADLDGDGDPDFVALAGERFVVENQTDGTTVAFGSPIFLELDDSGPTTVADVDGDGLLDVVGAHHPFGGPESLRYYLNETQDGSMSFSPSVTIDTQGYRIDDIESVDVDGDGDTDIVTSGYRALTLYVNDGTKEDGFFQSRLVDSKSSNRYQIAVEDFDRDSRPDIIVGAATDLYWHQNTSSNDTPSFTSRILLVDQPRVSEIWALSTTDVDGDALPDVIVGGGYSSYYDGSQPGLPLLGGVSWFRNGAELTLPVELVSFTAAHDEGRVRLNWRTLSEHNNAGFDVERAVNDGPFETISHVEGAGTTLQQQHYTLTDAALDYEANTATYRLRQIDLDGATTLSDPVSVTISSPEAVTLRAPFPNPARSSVTLQIGAPTPSRADVVVYNTLGQEVARPLTGQYVDGRAEVNIPVHTLAPGVYFVRLQIGDQVRTRRLTVVR